MISDLLKKIWFVRTERKRTILCFWGGSLQMVSESLLNLRWMSLHKPMIVTSKDNGFKERVIMTSHIVWV
jgi:hypothetical protein